MTSKQQFVDFFPRLVDDLLQDLDQLEALPESKAWVRRALDYNVQGGKMNRGLSVVDALAVLRCNATGNAAYQLTEAEWERATILGWCVELLQAFFLISDDIMDSSITRRGQPCWYRQPEVGMIAINDAFIVEMMIYRIVKKYFRQDSFYIDLVELLQDITFKTEMGQNLDLITAPEDQVDLTRFSMTKYRYIVKYKTSYYSFYLPVAMALLLAGVSEERAFKQAEAILLPLGEYFQIQDDYLDCYGAPELIGKIGTDIQDNKCSWLINQALLVASPAQLEKLHQHYGKRTSEDVAIVKAIYEELGIQKRFHDYEAESFNTISKLISEADSSLVPHQVFLDFMNKIYKRTK
ncbi:Farnesyl pyrophosphate synthetase [Dimargaris cristalligena]|uniref:Farnesyl pyrophosphate synthase n=1 Tax=Dimargaris cristalligena TaxID=215637 RepID=A0A4P9ZY55_9FUNG|nr:Farnesyl pyrophosphate synthetase [Dimargaris cristalligena]RKP37852.1 farnesyl pyrophosphate synthase [Dimargaris cristalligena]|eukprot:RKP37852.1 farnesyl pyrophosphate synthase [Dimargaris cristalligena]